MKYIITILFFIQTVTCFSEKDSTATGKRLSFDFNSSVFFIDNEFFSAFKEGYTLPGANFSPTFSLHTTNVHFSAGFTSLYYLEDELDLSIKPIISATIERNNFSITLGNFRTELNRLDQEYNKELPCTRPYKGGLLITNSNIVPFTFYIDWQNYIHNQDSAQEVFQGHLSSRLKNSTNKPLFFSHLLAFEIYHQGGQINADPKPPLTMIYSRKAGVETQILHNNKKHTIQCIALGFNDISENTLSTYDKGSAINTSYSLEWNKTTGTISFWKSQGYFAPYGNELFFSDKYSVGAQKSRSIFSLHLEKKSIFDKWAQLSTALYAHYDIDNKSTDYGFSIIMKLEDSFTLLNNF